MLSMMVAAVLAADPSWSFCGRSAKRSVSWSFCAPRIDRPAEFIETRPVEIRQPISYPVYRVESFSPCPGGRCFR